MSAWDLPTDDELRVWLPLAYPRTWAAAAGPPIKLSGEWPDVGGRASDDGLTAAFDAVEALIGEGAGIYDALQEVWNEHRLAKERNISFGSFARAYERHRDSYLRDRFTYAVLDGDIDRAIDALKRSSKRHRAEVMMHIASSFVGYPRP